MIKEINKAWNWIGFNAKEIIKTNDFGNVIFKSDKNEYWRICPEELSCEKIAADKFDFDILFRTSKFEEDWELNILLELAIIELGALKDNEKYCLKMAKPIGGRYSRTNLGKIDFEELIALSGDLAFQLKDLKDGDKIELNIKD